VKLQQHVPIHDEGQPADRTIRFRIGINIGDAIADGTDLHGDVVNVAVRLQAECPPGAICVTRGCATTCERGSILPSRRSARSV
jgi:adenylate cyclase